MKRVAALMLLAFLSDIAVANEYSLTTEEADFVRRLMAKDKLLAELPKAQKELETLNKFLSAASTGPVKVALQWNQVAIKAWRIANSSLEKIGKLSTCNEIDLMIAYETKNSGFFEELSEARGCKTPATNALAPANHQNEALAAITSNHAQINSEGAVIYSAEVAKAGEGWMIRPAPCATDIQFYVSSSAFSGFSGKPRHVRCPNGDQTQVQDVRLTSDGIVTVLSVSSVAGALAIADAARLSAAGARTVAPSPLESAATKKIIGRSTTTATANIQPAGWNWRFDPIPFPNPIPQPPKLPDAFDVQYPACIPVRQSSYWSQINQGVARGRELGLYSDRNQCRERITTVSGTIATSLGAPEITTAIAYGSDCGCNWEFR